MSNHEIETPFDPATRVISIFAVLLNGLFSGIFFLRVGVRVACVTLSPTIRWLISDANHSYQAWLLAGAVALVLDYTGLGLYIFPRAPLAEALAIMGGYPMVGYFFLKVCGRILSAFIIVHVGCIRLFSNECKAERCQGCYELRRPPGSVHLQREFRNTNYSI